MTEYTVCQLIDMACDQPGRRARVLKRRLRRSPEFREEFEDEMTDKLATNATLVSSIPAFGLPTFDKDTRFGVDSDQLRSILDTILEYAPRIMELILSIISLF